MPPPTPSILYTDQASIGSILSITGMLLTLDDYQVTTTYNDLALSSTYVVTSALQPFQSSAVGVNLVITGGVGWTPGTYVIQSVSGGNATLLASPGTPTLSGGQGYLVPNSAWIGYACAYGTSYVNRYCQQLYDNTDLVNSWSVWQWASILAANWLCHRRNNAVPASLGDWVEETKDDLKQVKSGKMMIEDIGYRNTLSPIWSNFRVDRTYTLRQLRVERPLSERTNPQFPQNSDVLADFTIEPPHI
jgi:hypothetical protein